MTMLDRRRQLQQQIAQLPDDHAAVNFNNRLLNFQMTN